MKKLYLLLFFTILLFSCENEPILDKTPKLVLKSAFYSDVNATDCSTDRLANFDNQGKITEVYHECNGYTTVFRSYDYRENGLIYYYTGTAFFTYDENDILIRISSQSDTGFSYSDITYENNIMLVHSFYNNQPFSWYSKYEFEDNTYEKLLSKKRFDSYDNEVIYRKTYKYNGNNPIEILIEEKNANNSVLEIVNRYIITYDDKINPYKFGLPKNAFLASSTKLLHPVKYNIVYTAENNITSIIYNYYGNNPDYVQTWTRTKTYTYNNDMHPIEAILYYNGEADLKEIFEYY